MRLHHFILITVTLQPPLSEAQTHWSIVARDSAGFDDIHFISLDTGFVVGTQNTAWRTTDGGSSWHQMELPANITADNCELASLSFPTNRIGYIAGFTNTNPDSGVLLRTTDAGTSWHQLWTDPPYPIRQIDFPTPSIGYLTMWLDTGYIAKTTDSGFTWSVDVAPFDTIFELVQFRDSEHGMFSAQGPNVDEGANFNWLNITSNGLQTWTSTVPRVGSFDGDLISAIGAVRNQIWCVAGGDHIFRTTDDGNTWTSWVEYATKQFPNINYIVGLAFDDTLGYAFTANVFKTTDAGVTWNYQLTMDSVATYAGTIFNDSIAYLLCELPAGSHFPYAILKTTDGGGPTISSGVSINFPIVGLFLFANPNPSTSNTTISFTLPESGAASLTIADAAGRETLLHHYLWLNAGPHEVTWNASKFPSGVYLCRLSVGENVVMRKLIVEH